MQNEEYRSSETSVTRGRLARAASSVIAIFLLSFVALLGYRVWAQMPDDEDRQRLVQQHPLLPPGVSIRPISKPVVGDLGGLRVTFPPEFANNVEYDGDPGFGEKRIGPKPERTLQSGLRSLGFEVRYPNVSVMSHSEVRADKSKYTIRNTPWLNVTITASSDFGDGQFLERMTAHMNRDVDFQFVKIPTQFYGLNAYAPATVDITKRSKNSNGVYESDARDRDIFVHYGTNQKVDTFIRCSNRNHDAAQCDHHFFLKEGIKASVTINYRRGMLVHWKEIQNSVIDLILKFQNS